MPRGRAESPVFKVSRPDPIEWAPARLHHLLATGGSELDLVELTGGKLVVGGALQTATASVGQTRRFEWSGGQLSAASITTSAGFDTPTTTGGLTSSALIQPTGTTLAPGDTGTAGRTTLTGSYDQHVGATLDLDLGSTTQATAFQTGGYDYLTVSGTTTLAGNLSVRLIGAFAVPATAPLGTTTFTVLNSTGTLSGAFANVPFGTRLTTAGGEGSFMVNKVGNTVTLSAYVAHTPRESWRYLRFATTANTGNAADLADPDGDGFNNLLEYALGTDPLQRNTLASLTTVSVATGQLQLTFNRLADPALTYRVEACADLAPATPVWTDIWTSTGPANVAGPVTVTDPTPIATLTPPAPLPAHSRDEPLSKP